MHSSVSSIQFKKIISFLAVFLLLEQSYISHKLQIIQNDQNSKSQTSEDQVSVIGNCDLDIVCYLLFGAWDLKR
jgi:hypothetical protein